MMFFFRLIEVSIGFLNHVFLVGLYAFLQTIGQLIMKAFFFGYVFLLWHAQVFLLI
jgi:hypothetical protein